MTYKRFLGINLLVLGLGGYGLNRLAVFVAQIAATHHGLLPAWVTTGASFTTELSLALTIAVCLNLLVERFTRARHESLERQLVENVNVEVSKDLLRTVFKKNLPDSVVQQIEAHLFSGAVCKTEWHSRYFLDIVEEGDPPKRFVVWEASDTYTLHNMDRRPHDHKVAIEFDVARHYETKGQIKVLEVGGKLIQPEGARTGRRLSMAHWINLQPGQRIEVRTVQCGAGPTEFHEVICSLLPVDDFTVTVTHPKELKVSATSLHPDMEATLVNESRQKQWRMRGVFPGQGIDISWSEAAAHPVA
jgi:hypothetical protein